MAIWEKKTVTKVFESPYSEELRKLVGIIYLGKVLTFVDQVKKALT
jgi:hypothetical protein